MTKEVWCAAGKRVVNLPKESCDQSLMTPALCQYLPNCVLNGF